eukprot:6241646-Pyramimonas_sp.AAC.1
MWSPAYSTCGYAPVQSSPVTVTVQYTVFEGSGRRRKCGRPRTAPAGTGQSSPVQSSPVTVTVTVAVTVTVFEGSGCRRKCGRPHTAPAGTGQSSPVQ